MLSLSLLINKYEKRTNDNPIKYPIFLTLHYSELTRFQLNLQILSKVGDIHMQCI